MIALHGSIGFGNSIALMQCVHELPLRVHKLICIVIAQRRMSRFQNMFAVFLSSGTVHGKLVGLFEKEENALEYAHVLRGECEGNVAVLVAPIASDIKDQIRSL